MKIGVIHHAISYGGVNKSLIAFLSASINHDITLFLYRQDADMDYSELPKNVTVVSRSNTRKSQEFLWLFKSVTKDFDLFVGFMTLNGFYSVLLGRVLSVPVLFSERGFPKSERGILARLKVNIVERSNYAWFQTVAARKCYKSFDEKNSFIIPNYVNSDNTCDTLFSKRKSEIAFVGRFELRQKRQDVAVNVLNELKDFHKDIKLNFFGDGDDQEHIQEMVMRLDLGDKVIFHGTDQDVSKSLCDFKFFLFTSDYEGMPNALMEGMAAGCVCLSVKSDPGGPEVLIKDGINGYIFEKGDVSRIAEKIKYIFSNDSSNMQISRAAIADMKANYSRKLFNAEVYKMLGTIEAKY